MKNERVYKELCLRQPYGVMCCVYGDESDPVRLTGVKDADTAYFESFDWKENDGLVEIGFVKPYLRPMDSMTDREKRVRRLYVEDEEVRHLNAVWNRELVTMYNLQRYCEWLVENHFDFNNLIGAGLALPAPEGMYPVDRGFED